MYSSIQWEISPVIAARLDPADAPVHSSPRHSVVLQPSTAREAAVLV